MLKMFKLFPRKYTQNRGGGRFRGAWMQFWTRPKKSVCSELWLVKIIEKKRVYLNSQLDRTLFPRRDCDLWEARTSTGVDTWFVLLLIDHQQDFRAVLSSMGSENMTNFISVLLGLCLLQDFDPVLSSECFKFLRNPLLKQREYEHLKTYFSMFVNEVTTHSDQIGLQPVNVTPRTLEY